MHNYLTEEAINKLKEEIEYRKVVVRHKILEDIKEARAHGDLSENFEYKAAKRERAKNESRIRYLERMIRTAKIIKDTTSEDEVGIGKSVSVRFLEDNEVDEFKIVTTIEADPLNNMISIESPLGKAIYKHKVGDEVMVESPQGRYAVRIEKITVE
ncbi:transcription elongation factor GreA [Fonticella tunisiensis]|uniref:Transcription elongation factor GreA n=1 Tax=Fonticella tunisiensis TaxID=1096341 RepID=A0A4R7KPR9_9CLOT|nr:transcription elongation factor GreA [Fonticella tunisiensis]TDT61111.1 transcription elongation factor GreA [Fonticella tunisiensis]